MCAVAYTETQNNGLRSIGVYLNGITAAQIVFSATQQPSGNNTIEKHLTICTQLNLALNDAVRIGFTTTQAGGTVDIIGGTGSTYWAMTRLSN